MSLPRTRRWLLPYALSVAALLPVSSSPGQDRTSGNPWSSWRMVLGDWVGGDGSQAQGRSTFTFSSDLQNTILVRKSHGEYPATADRPAFTHDDLTIVYREQGGGFRAVYFDNEQHVIHYAVEFSPDSARITFLSDTTANGPAFRLTYWSAGADSLQISFAIAPPGSPRHFAPYRQGSAHRKR